MTAKGEQCEYTTVGEESLVQVRTWVLNRLDVIADGHLERQNLKRDVMIRCDQRTHSSRSSDGLGAGVK